MPVLGQTPTEEHLNATTPAAPSGQQNVVFQAGTAYADPNNPVLEVRDITAYMPDATASLRGGVALAGDLGGTAASPTVVGLEGKPLDAATVSSPSDGQVITYSATAGKYKAETPASSGGTVTSVALTMPTEFNVSGSPITSSGTLAVTKANESANTVYAGPSSGSAAAPTFRALLPADLPAATGSAEGIVQLDGDLGGTAALPTVVGLEGTPLDAATVGSPTDGEVITYSTSAGKYKASTLPLAIGYVIQAAFTGTNVGPILIAPRAASLSKCIVAVGASDPILGLTFRIRKNGTDVFSTDPSEAAGTASGTVTTFTSLTSSPLAVSAGDTFTLDITAGSSLWQFTAQLET